MLYGFIQYRELARETNLSGRLQANMLMMRMNTKDFIITASQKDIDEFHNYLGKMDEFIIEAKNMIRDGQRTEKISIISNKTKEYQAAFNKMTELCRERDHLVRRIGTCFLPGKI